MQVNLPDVSQEFEALLQFLYMAPVGLAQLVVLWVRLLPRRR